MKKGLFIVLALVMAAVMLFAGCSAQRSATTSDSAEYYAEEPAYEKMEADTQNMDTAGSYDMDDMAAPDMEQAYPEDADTGSGIDINGNSSVLEPTVDRKIIYTGSITARTKKFDEDYNMIMDSVTKAGGYIENAYVYGTEPEEWQDEGRYAEITLRVPSEKFDEFIDMLKGVGETTNSSVSGRDISLQYFDVETRLETLRIREERLQELLEKAASLEDIIELERELSNVSYEIQSYEIEKRNYDSLIDFSQITVSLQEVADQAEIVAPQESVGESMKNGFFNVLNGVAVFGRWLLVAIVAISPVLAILAVILVIVLLSVRAAKRKRERKQNEDKKGM